ncbi:MAG: winged helix-turn-helix transcriptional regulator [Anaerolineaceae bacterium]|nr:winged helix-turn-helix transcriptional regulator [Anaerolineaceae bacterium]
MVEKRTLTEIIEVTTAMMAEVESQAFKDETFSQLSMRQMLYFNKIIQMESPTFSDLARELDVTKPSVSAIVNTLIEKGFVEKVQDQQDKRVYHIALTAQGRDFDQLHDSVHQRMVSVLTANLDEQEITTLTELLGKAMDR